MSTDDLDRRIQALLDEHDPATTEPRDFLGAQFDAGLAWVHLPQGFGGLGLPRKAQETVNARLFAAGAPVGGTAKNFIGMGMAAPTIAAFGTDEQKRKFLRPLFTGEQVYCQLFSEPGAGSDLAGWLPGRPRRRRLDCQRAEGMDVDGAARADGHPGCPHRSDRAQARGPDLLPLRHDATGRGRPAAAPDHR